jgi:hypothetical protein
MEVGSARVRIENKAVLVRGILSSGLVGVDHEPEYIIFANWVGRRIEVFCIFFRKRLVPLPKTVTAFPGRDRTKLQVIVTIEWKLQLQTKGHYRFVQGDVHPDICGRRWPVILEFDIERRP